MNWWPHITISIHQYWCMYCFIYKVIFTNEARTCCQYENICLIKNPITGKTPISALTEWIYMFQHWFSKYPNNWDLNLKVPYADLCKLCNTESIGMENTMMLHFWISIWWNMTSPLYTSSKLPLQTHVNCPDKGQTEAYSPTTCLIWIGTIHRKSPPKVGPIISRSRISENDTYWIRHLLVETHNG